MICLPGRLWRGVIFLVTVNHICRRLKVSSDKIAALEQWEKAYSNAEQMLLSIVNSSYTDPFIWRAAKRSLSESNGLVKIILKEKE